MNTTQNLPSENEPKTLYEKVCQERDEYRKALEAIFACDGMPGFDAAEAANKTLSKYNDHVRKENC